MKLTDMTVKDYLACVASDAPAPGGGSAAALSGAQGCALAAMVAKLTIGKKKYPDDQALCLNAAGEAEALARALEAQVDCDTEAYEEISAAYKLPKENEEQCAARKRAIADATLVAAEVPLDTLRLARDGLLIVSCLVGHSNVNCGSDLGVAALNLVAAARGAWMNVRINLPCVDDEARASALQTEGKELLLECEELGARAYEALLAGIGG